MFQAPSSRSRRVVVSGGSAGQRKQQPDRVVGDFEGAVVGCVAHGDAAPRAGIDVDVIESDPGLDDDLRPAHLGHQMAPAAGGDCGS